MGSHTPTRAMTEEQLKAAKETDELKQDEGVEEISEDDLEGVDGGAYNLNLGTTFRF